MLNSNGSGKPFNEWTRQQKRHATVTIKGVTMTIWEYIKMVETKLPKARNKETQQDINHAQQLRIYYMESGYAGIQEYCKIIAELTTAAVNDLKKENDRNIAEELAGKKEAKVIPLNADKIADGVAEAKKPRVKKEKVDGEEAKPKARKKKEPTD